MDLPNITSTSPHMILMWDGKKYRINLADYDASTGNFVGVIRQESERVVSPITGIRTPQGIVFSKLPTLDNIGKEATHTTFMFQGNMTAVNLSGSASYGIIGTVETADAGECSLDVHISFTR